DKRTLAVMNIDTGKTVTPDASFAGAGHGEDKDRESKDGTPQKKAATPEARWAMPQISEDGALAVAHGRSGNNKDRWLVAVDPESGKTRVLDLLHDDAWVRELGGFGPNDPSFGWMPDQKRIWFLSERDGWMHLYTLDASTERPSATQLTRGKW